MPSESDSGEFTLTIRVTDQNGAFSERATSLEVIGEGVSSDGDIEVRNETELEWLLYK